MTPHLEHEIMSPAFEKWHIRGIGADNKAIHKFTAPDTGYAHNHPFSFTTHILEGSYVEEVYYYDTFTKQYKHRTVWRHEGTSHKVFHDTIHRIIRLPQGSCTTICTYGEWKEGSGFYKFEDGKAYYKDWNETDDKFRLVEI